MLFFKVSMRIHHDSIFVIMIETVIFITKRYVSITNQIVHRSSPRRRVIALDVFETITKNRV